MNAEEFAAVIVAKIEKQKELDERLQEAHVHDLEIMVNGY